MLFSDSYKIGHGLLHPACLMLARALTEVLQKWLLDHFAKTRSLLSLS